MLRKVFTRRRMFIAFAAFFFCLTSLAIALPYLASSGAGTRMALNLVNGYLPGEARIHNVDLGWAGGLLLENVELTDPDGNVVVSVGRIEAPDLGVLDLWDNPAALGRLRIADTQVFVVHYPDGTNSLMRALPMSSDDSESTFDLATLAFDVELDNVVLQSQVQGQPAVLAKLNGRVTCDGPSGSTIDLDAVWTNGESPAGATRIQGDIGWVTDAADDGALAWLPMRIDRAEGRLAIDRWSLDALDRLAFGKASLSLLLGPSLDGKAAATWTRGQAGQVELAFDTRLFNALGDFQLDPAGKPVEGQLDSVLKLEPTDWLRFASRIGVADWELLEPAEITFETSLTPGDDPLSVELTSDPLAFGQSDGRRHTLRLRGSVQTDEPAAAASTRRVTASAAVDYADTLDAPLRPVITLNGAFDPAAALPARPVTLDLDFDRFVTAHLPGNLNPNLRQQLERLGGLSGKVAVLGPTPTAENGELRITTDLSFEQGAALVGETQAAWRLTPDAPRDSRLIAHSDEGLRLTATAELLAALTEQAMPSAGITPTSPLALTLLPQQFEVGLEGSPRGGMAKMQLDDLGFRTAGGIDAALAGWSGMIDAKSDADPVITLRGTLGHDQLEGQIQANARMDTHGSKPGVRDVRVEASQVPAAWLDPFLGTPGLAGELFGPTLQTTVVMTSPDGEQHIDLTFESEHADANAAFSRAADGRVELRSEARAALVMQPEVFGRLQQQYAPGISMGLNSGDTVVARVRVPMARVAMQNVAEATPEQAPSSSELGNDAAASGAFALPFNMAESGIDLEVSIEPVSFNVGGLGAMADVQRAQLTVSAPRLDQAGSVSAQLRMAGRSEAAEGPSVAVNGTGVLLSADARFERAFDAAGRFQPLLLRTDGDFRLEADAALLSAVLRQGGWLSKAMGDDGRLEARWGFSGLEGGSGDLKLTTESGVDLLATAERASLEPDLGWSIDFAVPKQWGAALMRSTGPGSRPIARPGPGSGPGADAQAQDEPSFASDTQYQVLQLSGRFDPYHFMLTQVQGRVEAHLDFRRSNHLPPTLARMIQQYEIVVRPTLSIEAPEIDPIRPFFSSFDLMLELPAASFKLRDTIAPFGRSTVQASYAQGEISLTQLNVNVLRGNVFATGNARLAPPQPGESRPLGTIPAQLELRVRNVELRPVATMLFDRGTLPARVGGVLSADLNARGHALQLLGTLAGTANVRVRDGNLAPVPIVSDIVKFLVERLPHTMRRPVQNAMEQAGLIWRPGGHAAPAFGSDTADIDMLLKTNRVHFNSIDMLTQLTRVRGNGNLFLTGHTDFWLQLGDGNGNPALRVPMAVALRAVGRQVRVVGPVQSPTITNR